MDKLRFFPVLTDELIDRCGLVAEKYRFSYSINGMDTDLLAKGTSVVKISDPLDMWKLKEDGLTVKTRVSVAYPDFLFGPEGIACRNAEIGICIIWTNHNLPQTGHILPQSDISNAAGRTCFFEHTFLPGEIEGDLELSVCLYIRRAADEVGQDEENLMNEEGVFIGETNRIAVDFDSIYMEFPIEEYSSANEPLWWIEFSKWEDPKTVEKFTKENVCIYLNPYYAACPMTDGNIKNVDMLIEILATAYTMIFRKLSDEDLKATRFDTGLEANSVCSILHAFIESCNTTELRFETPEMLHKTLSINIRAMLTAEDEQS